jgi:hypothetical protein
MSHENYRYRSYRAPSAVEVAKALSGSKHEIIRASRNGEVKVNLEDSASIRAMFEKIQGVDAVISCAGNAAFMRFPDLTDADYELGLRSKLMVQVTLARIAKDHLQGDECAAFPIHPHMLRHACFMPWRIPETIRVRFRPGYGTRISNIRALSRVGAGTV